jgi:uncharacterized membrane protein YeaQ/YmgE (transglycosylase-associated protein family)
MRVLDELAFYAVAGILLIVAVRRILIWSGIADKDRLKFPWLIIGMLVGFLVALFFTPAYATAGIPIDYAARVVGGTIAGAVAGAIIEARRRAQKVSNRE